MSRTQTRQQVMFTVFLGATMAYLKHYAIISRTYQELIRMKTFKIILVIAIMILGIFLWSNLGSKDRVVNMATYPYYESEQTVTGETYYNGQFYDVVQTITVTTHLRAKQSTKLNRYELKFLDK